MKDAAGVFAGVCGIGALESFADRSVVPVAFADDAARARQEFVRRNHAS
jgi:hypothetical protein